MRLYWEESLLKCSGASINYVAKRDGWTIRQKMTFTRDHLAKYEVVRSLWDFFIYAYYNWFQIAFSITIWKINKDFLVVMQDFFEPQ